MKKQMNRFWKEAFMLFFIHLAFALVGMAAFLLMEHKVWMILLGIVSCIAPFASTFMFARSDGSKAAQMLYQKGLPHDAFFDANRWTVWHAFRTPLIAIAIPFGSWLIAVLIGLFAAKNGVAAFFRVVVWLYYSGFSAVCMGAGHLFASSAFSVLWVYIPVFLLEVGLYALGYYLAGRRIDRSYREIAVEIGINRRG